MIAKFLEKAQEAISARRRYMTTLRELYKLSDRELSDLGIDRSEIDRVARESAHRGVYND